MRDARTWLVVVSALAGCGEVKDPTPPDAPGGSAATVTISPANPKTADDLVATVSGATVTLRWSLNAVVRTDVTGATIANSLTAKGERWAVDAVSSTGEVLDHDEVVIGNTAPSMFDVEVQISGAAASPVPCAIVAMATDDDADTVTYAATWLRNGVAYTNATMTTFPGDTVPGADHAAGDQFECSVAASDGADMTTAIAGGRVLVPNGVPPNGTIQNFTTPAVASLRVEAGGAHGASGAGTNGAVMIGTFSPAAGSVLQILVGQSPTSLAGGGGTFVMASATMPMVIAGGGGSVFSATVPVAESQGRIVTSGGTAGAVVRADNGQGGRNVSGSNSGAGGGLLANGAGTGGGQGFAAGAAGGGTMAENQWGGFGGGGGRTGLWGQGGGGGYSGGSCADTYTAPIPPATTGSGTWVGCGGGGSINMGTDPVNTAGGNTGTGYVKITW